MKLQLLIFVALAGPFCAFTFASPTALPEELLTATGAATVVTLPVEAETVVPTLRQVEPSTAPEVVTEPPTPTESPTTPERVVTTEAAPEAAEEETMVLVVDAEAEPTDATDTLDEVTDAPADAEVVAEATVAAKAAPETAEEVVIEEGAEEGLSSGQVAGIVIGALLAVIILIAVVIAAVRRMGKYSP